MRVLIVTSGLPYPPASGGALRVYGIMRGLYEAGHAVTLLAFCEPGAKPAQTPLAQWCEAIHCVPAPTPRRRADRLRDLLLTRQPDIARRLYSDAFASALRECLRATAFDVVQIEAIEMACYLPVARAEQPGATLIFDTFNAEYLLQRLIFDIDRRDLRRLPAAAYSWVQARRIAWFEGAMCRTADAVIAVSPEDADALRGFRPDRRVTVVPSGITVADYRPAEHPPDLGEHALIFTGKMDYRPNVDAMLWFYEAIYPRVRARQPAAHLVIVGQQPHPRLDALRADPSVTITGWVDSVQPYLDAGAVYIAPLRMGSGTRLKLLEAMASRCAIVATTLAASGMLPEVKAALCVEDSAEGFADAIIRLLNAPDERRALGERARAQVSAHYDWSVIIPRLLGLYEEIGHG